MLYIHIPKQKLEISKVLVFKVFSFSLNTERQLRIKLISLWCIFLIIAMRVVSFKSVRISILVFSLVISILRESSNCSNTFSHLICWAALESKTSTRAPSMPGIFMLMTKCANGNYEMFWPFFTNNYLYVTIIYMYVTSACSPNLTNDTKLQIRSTTSLWQTYHQNHPIRALINSVTKRCGRYNWLRSEGHNSPLKYNSPLRIHNKLLIQI